MYTVMKKIKLASSIFLLALFACSYVYAQDHQPADENWYKAQDLEKQGKYIDAAKMYEKSAEAEKTSPVQGKSNLATDLNRAGYYYSLAGQYNKAVKSLEEALTIFRKLGQEDKVAIRLNNIGGVFETQGKYAKALEYYQEAMDTAGTVKQDNNIAINLANIGNIFKYWDQHEVAVKYYEDALAIDRKLGQEDKVAILLSYIGGVYKSTRQYDDALKYYKEALEINRKLGKEAGEALGLKNLDMAYRFYWSKHDKAIKPHELKLVTDKKSGKDEDISGDLNNVGMIYVLQKEYKTAIEYFNESVSLIEKLRRTTAGEERRNYLARQIYASQLLASAFIKDSDISSAFQTIELSRAKLMAERFARKEKNIRLQEIKQIRETLGEDTAIIVYANVNSEDIIQFTITREELTGREVSRKSFVQSSMDKFRAPIKTLLINQNSLSENKNDFDNIINYYSSLLREPSPQDEGGRRTNIDKPGESPRRLLSGESPRRLLSGESPPRLPDGQGRLLSGESSHGANAGEIGRRLHELLIKPMEAQIKDKKNLIIIPDGIL